MMADDRLDSRENALVQLILLALHRRGGKVEQEHGRVPSALRTICDIPSTPSINALTSTVLVWMASTGLINRESREKGTYKVELLRSLRDDEVQMLQAAEPANREAVQVEVAIETDSESQLDALVTDCARALKAIRQAVTLSEHHLDGGLVGVSMSSVLKGIAIRGPYAAKIRHYLRELNYVKCIRKHEQISYLYWWRIDMDRPFNEDALRRLATSEKSYEASLASKGRNAPLEGGRREREYAKQTPAVLPDSMCSPVETRKVAPEANGRASKQAAGKDGTLSRLLEIVQQLERDKAELGQENEELKQQNTSLRNRLEQYETDVDLASDVLARYSH